MAWIAESEIMAVVDDSSDCESCCDDCCCEGFDEKQADEPSYNPLDYKKITIEYFIKN